MAPEESWAGNLHEKLRARIQHELELHRVADLDEANALVARLMEEYNAAPQPEMGGMSPAQAWALTRPGWIDTALILNDRLTVADLALIPLLTNARLILLTVHEQGGVLATQTGAFNRAFVKQLCGAMTIDPDALRYLEHNKQINQDDVSELRMMRILLQLAGLIRYARRTINVTKLGRRLIAEEAAGELYALLFRTLLTRVNLAYMDRMPEAPGIQRCIGATLYQISRRCDDWAGCDELVPYLFLPAVQDEILSTRVWQPLYSFARIRVLRHLEDFGVLQLDREPDRPSRVRKTSLFDRFLSFQLD